MVSRVLRNLVDQVWQSLSALLPTFTQSRGLADQWSDGHEKTFPSLSASPAVGGWKEESAYWYIPKDASIGNIELLWREAAIRYYMATFSQES